MLLNKYFFVKYPDNTAEDGEESLVKYFKGSLVVVGAELPDEDWIKDTVTIYRTSRVEESDGFPKQSGQGNS